MYVHMCVRVYVSIKATFADKGAFPKSKIAIPAENMLSTLLSFAHIIYSNTYYD